MPQMANIVVKKADNTTDVTYTAIIASAGDKTSARWENATVGTTRAERPVLMLRSEGNSSKTARRLTGVFAWPISSTDVNGRVSITGSMNANFTVLVPQNQTNATITEQTYQFCNLLAAALIKQSLADGYAPV